MSVGQMTHMLGYVIQLTRDGRFFDAFKLLLQVIVSLAMQLFMYFTYLPSDFEKLRKGSGSAGGQGGHSHGGHGHSHGPSAPQQNIRVDPNGLDHHGAPPLHRAANQAQVSACQVLVYLGAEVDGTGTLEMQETALMWAARNGNLETVKSLVSMGADPEKRDALGWTPLHHACSQQERGKSLLVAHYIASLGVNIEEQAAEKKNPGLAKLLQGDDAKAVEALAPWVSFEETFQRPNQATVVDFAGPIVSVPVVFYALGSFPWYLAVAICGALMYVVGSALVPGGGKPKAQPTFHAFYIGCVLMTYGVWFSVVGLGKSEVHPSMLRIFVFYACSVCLAVSFYVASYTDPGVLKPNKEGYNDVLVAVARGLKLDGMCATCAIRKPQRSKHCSVLDVCVVQFDHFCPWCNNAVGANNYLGFVGWCFFEAVCHLFLIYDLWQWCLLEVGQAGTFPHLVSALLKINRMHPTVLYLIVFNIMSLLMACQLIKFQLESITLNLTTNERMNAYRYPYLMAHLQTQLVGNPYDLGGFQPNFKALVHRGLFPALPALEYKAIEFDIDSKLTAELDPFEGGINIPIPNANGVGAVVESAGVHRWHVAQRKRIEATQDPAQRQALCDDLRNNFVTEIRKLSTLPSFQQNKTLKALAKPGRGGFLEDQVAEVKKEAEELKATQKGRFGMSEEEKRLMEKITGKPREESEPARDPKPEDMTQQPDGSYRRLTAEEKAARDSGKGHAPGPSSSVDEEARDAQAKEAKDVMVKKQLAMMEHMVAKQKEIAAEVMNEEQYAVFSKGIEAMEQKGDIMEKQMAMQESQKVLQGLLTPQQVTEIQTRVQQVMQKYVAEHGHPMAKLQAVGKKSPTQGEDVLAAALDRRMAEFAEGAGRDGGEVSAVEASGDEAAAQGEQAAEEHAVDIGGEEANDGSAEDKIESDDEEEDEEEEEESEEDSDDDSDDEEEDDEEDLVVKQARMVAFMVSSQKRIAEEVMDTKQLEIYRPLVRKVEEANTMQAKQAAMKAAKEVWQPLLSQEQQGDMERQMKLAMASFNTGGPPPASKGPNAG